MPENFSAQSPISALPRSMRRPLTPGRFRAYPKLRIPGQSQTCHNLAALLSVARLYVTTQSRGNPCQFERCLALPKVWWANAGHRKAYHCGDPAPFSAVRGCRRRMKRRSTSRNSRLLPLATSLCVFCSKQSLFPTPQGQPCCTTFEPSATLLVSRLGALFFRAPRGRRQTYFSSIEFA